MVRLPSDGCHEVSDSGAPIKRRYSAEWRRTLLYLHAAPVQSLELHLFGLMASFEKCLITPNRPVWTTSPWMRVAHAFYRVILARESQR